MFQIQTPAKINPLLYILKKRPDGYHELYMHMVPISLFDTLRFEDNGHQGIQLSVEGIQIDGDPNQNLVLKATRLFEQRSGKLVHQTIHLQKQIPVGAGLGGGSGNAAGTLVALNYLYQSPLTVEQLKMAASELGSDVPFFIEPCPCEVQGRGEKIQPLSTYPSCWLVVVKPPFSISTAQAYGQCRPLLQKEFPSIPSFDAFLQNLYNQFEVTLLPNFPELLRIKEILLQNGALAALVSGSGSSVFGVFRNQMEQQQAYAILSSTVLGNVFLCQTLTYHRYC